MDPLKSIVRNSSLLIAAQGCSSLIGMALIVILPRFLGDAEFGRLHLALSLTLMFGVAVEFGLTQVLARAVARQYALARPYAGRAVALVGVLGIVLYLGLGVVARLLGYHPDVVELVAILGIVMVAEALSQVLTALFQAHERMLAPALARIAANLLTLATVFPLLLHGHGPLAVAAVMAAAAVLRVGINTVAARRLAGFAMTGEARPDWLALLSAGLPFLVWQALGIFYFRMDVVMLGWLTSDATVGWYGAASRLTDALCFVPQILTMATFPIAARLWISDRAAFQRTVRDTLHLLLLVTVPASVGVVTLAQDIVALLFTLESFGPAVPILRVHGFTLGLLFVDFFLVGVLMAIGQERRWIAIAGAACVVSPLLSRVLIPLAEARFGNGGIGAATGTLLTEAFIMACALRLMPAGTLGKETQRVAGQAALAGGVMALLIAAGGALDVPWPVAAAAGSAAYASLVIWLGLLPPEASRWLWSRVARWTPAGVAP
jgi:O-antigen/teichoic acid export membrane protein